MSARKLTAEEAADLAVHREIWRAHGLSTEPANFDRAKEAITWIYEHRLGKPAPTFLCFSSPMMCVLAIAAIKRLAKGSRKGPLRKLKLYQQLGQQLDQQLGQQLGQQLYQQLGQQLGQQLDQQLGQQLGQQLYQQLDQQLYQQLYQQLGQQLGQQLDQQLGQQLDQQLDQQLGQQLDQQLGQQLYQQDLRDAFYLFRRYWWLTGQTTASWIASHTFAAKIGVKHEPSLWRFFEAWATLGECCSWWMVFDGLCIISDRPRVLRFDAERRLHCEIGPAIAFSDGWGVHAWHGTHVPASWIDDRPSLTAKIALTWPNIEQRRVACEILGWNAILAELNATTIDRDAEPEIGELLEVTIPDVGRERFLRVRCGTGRTFALPVPPHMQTALQANAWTYGIDDAAKFVKPEVRT